MMKRLRDWIADHHGVTLSDQAMEYLIAFLRTKSQDRRTAWVNQWMRLWFEKRHAWQKRSTAPIEELQGPSYKSRNSALGDRLGFGFHNR